eukprot:TRINITY_DN4216_c0_g1_i1.p1 TRINITY_DN4216_c0_g1~~TRINITY_DN4216_c0_g1_i1.p1  ORF type:complete len:289 (+),score=77.23 TRINITY_DN4216_c0_g1_i1:33-899(+)
MSELMSDREDIVPEEEEHQYKRSRKRGQPSPDSDTSERPSKVAKYSETSKSGEEGSQEGPGGEVEAIKPRSAKEAAKKALSQENKDKYGRKRAQKRRLSSPESIVDYAAELKKQYEEVDSFEVPTETIPRSMTFKRRRRPSENVFEFIELIDPEGAERIKKRRDEAVRRGTEVLKKHHDLGKPFEEISEDTTREVTEEVRKVFVQPEPLPAAPKSPQTAENDENMLTPTKEMQENEIPENEKDIFEVTPLPADHSALSANVNLKATPSSPTSRQAKKRGRKAAQSNSA